MRVFKSEVDPMHCNFYYFIYIFIYLFESFWLPLFFDVPNLFYFPCKMFKNCFVQVFSLNFSRSYKNHSNIKVVVVVVN